MPSNTSSDNTKMSASSKTTKKTVATTVSKSEPVVAAASAPAQAQVPAVKAEKTPKVPKAPKALKAEVVAVAPVVVTAVSAATAVSAVPEDVVGDEGSALSHSVSDLHTQLSEVKTALSAALTAVKIIEKQAAKVIRKSDRRRKGRKAAAVPGEPVKPNAFTIPIKLSNELCSFLGKSNGSEASRAEVTKAVSGYAKDHSLMDKQTIKADATLRKLLSLNETDNLSILNLQRYLKPHYPPAKPKAVKVAKATA